MREVKRDIFAILVGSIIWLLFAMFLQKPFFLIWSEDLRTDLTFLWIFGFSISFFAAIYVGWRGTSRGWILGLLNQVMVTVFLSSFIQISSFAASLSSKGAFGLLESFVCYISIQLPWFLSASVGGAVGQRFRKVSNTS
jgi:hypothetical protein